ncbi:MlaD family protein [Winogradskyella ursingii]|uniref:MlaD family protein n=1 Tax=Winogradskyella ursingii TaxID=2686079 RepID=UPI0015CB82A3|nr:MlaD family protein [Winogradskyella ursingii]
MKISREVKTAILVLAGIALFIYLFTFLRGDDLFSNKDVYYTEFDYNALTPSAPVTVKGNKIGKVEEIKYNFETGKTRVAFSIVPEFKFSKNSLVRLYQTGLMGGNALSIEDSNDGELAEPGDFIKSSVKPGLVTTLEEDFSGISEDLGTTLRTTDTLMTNLNTLIIDDSEKGLKQAIAELNSTLKSFKGLSYSVQNLVQQNDEKIAALLTNLEKVTSDFGEISADLKEADFSATIQNLDKTLTDVQSMLAAVNNSDGTIGKLLNDATLYNNLEGASQELELLLLDIKLHPARYRRILSKREIPYEEPTQEELNKN